MTIDMVLNICFVLLIGNIFGVLAASNIGYVLAHIFALTGFILLRRDRPNWPRPIKLGTVWMPIAGVLAVWSRPHDRRLRLVPERRRRLRRHEGEGHRLLRARDLSCCSSSSRIVQDGSRSGWREDTPDAVPAPRAGAIDAELRVAT